MKTLILGGVLLLAACTTVPVLDANGDPVLDADGEPKTKQVWSNEKAQEAAGGVAAFLPPPFNALAFAAIPVLAMFLPKKKQPEPTP